MQEGITALAKVRTNWMDCSQQLIRAARHYERAVHILIRKNLESVQSQMIDASTTSNRVNQPDVGRLRGSIYYSAKFAQLNKLGFSQLFEIRCLG